MLLKYLAQRGEGLVSVSVKSSMGFFFARKALAAKSSSFLRQSRLSYPSAHISLSVNSWTPGWCPSTLKPWKCKALLSRDSRRLDWIYLSLPFHFLCRMKLYVPAAAALLCQSWAATPVPVYPEQGRAQWHADRCVLTSLALSSRRRSMDCSFFLRGESLHSHLSLQFLCSAHDPWSFVGGSDRDSDKTPAFISSTASQELFDCAVSAICASCNSVNSLCRCSCSVHVCTSTFQVYFWLLRAKPASLRDLQASSGDVTMQVALMRLRSLSRSEWASLSHDISVNTYHITIFFAKVVHHSF